MRETKVRPRYRYDRGQVLVLKGIRDLPDFYEVHFANIGGEADATAMIGTAEGVIIPDSLFESAAGILAYIYIHDEATDGTTIYKVTIPIIDRPRPADTEPTEEEADIISQAIVALNENVGRAEESAETAQSAADGAAQAERNAGVSAERAEAAEQAAETSATSASSSAAAAQAAAQSAAESESQASAHKDAAMEAADDASASSASAYDHASAAQSAAGQAEQYKNTAVAAGNAAQTAATNAGAARTAAEAAQTAAESAQTAAEDARGAAETARTDAQTYAGQAVQSATDAAQSAAGAAQTIGQVRAEGAAQIAAVDAKGQRVLDSIPEDYSQMEDDITDLKSHFQPDTEYEEIVLSAPELKQYIATNGSTVQWDNPSTSSSTFIQWAVVPCVEGDVFQISGKGGNSDRLWVFANSQKQILSRADANITVTNLSLVAPQNAAYLIINTEIRALSFKVSAEKSLASDISITSLSVPNSAIAKDQTDFVKVVAVNLTNPQEFVVGVVTNSANSGQIDGTQTGWITTDYIPVIPGHNYFMYMDLGVFYGQVDRGVPYYSKEKQYLGRVLPHDGISSSEKLDYVTIPNNDNIGYIRTSFLRSYANTPKLWYKTMIVEGVWPGNMYITYDGDYRLRGVGLDIEHSEPLNCLFGKSALWNGDSICAADNDTENGGWPQRIATSNGMRCKNYAIAGGTIAENTGTGVHSVSGTLDTMISEFSDADYVIIEGGTNDADILGADGIGTFDADDFSAEYIAALDKDTFSGALESIFYRLVTQMKGKHIGYLIPQKMGHTEVLVARRRTYFDRAIDICKKWGIPCLDLWNGLYFNWRLAAHWDQSMTSAENEAAGNLYMDGQHLTTTGYAIQSPIIAEWMKTI